MTTTPAERAELEKRTERKILDYLNGANGEEGPSLRYDLIVSGKPLPACWPYFWKNVSAGIFDASAGVYRKSTNPYAISGTSDILGIWDGRFVAIEVKRPGNENGATDEQRAFIAKINQLGGVAFVATSVQTVRQEFLAAGLLAWARDHGRSSD